MRIKRLAITGFGPYKTTQTVDFEAFEGDGLFLITGKTGAGKSSILDAICFALYGTVPRYEGTQQKLRSDHAAPDDPTSVELEFTVDADRYRLIRSPEYERLKKNGTGTTPQKATAELAILVGGEWEGIAAIPRTVAAEIDRIVGLTKEQFLQVILLAQNRFQEFLLAKGDERQKLLRSLFGTRRFLDIETTLVERRKKLDAQLGSVRESLAQDAARVASLIDLDEVPEPSLAWFDDVLAGLLADRETVDAQASAARAAYRDADLAHRAVESSVALQMRRAEAEARLAALDAQHAAVDDDRARVALARDGAAVWPRVQASADADAAAQRASERLRVALEAYGEVSDESDAASTGTPDADTLARAIDDLTRTLGTLDEAERDERALDALAREIAAATKRVDDLTATLARATADHDELPSLLDELAAVISAVTARAAAKVDAAERVTRITAARAAAASADTLTTKHTAALQSAAADAAAHVAAAHRASQLMDLRLAGHAAELATGLRDDEPCAVCGSTVHPAPATSDAEPVTLADVEEARAHAETLRQRADTAHLRATDLGTQLAEALARADGKSIDILDAELADAETRLADARAAAREAAQLTEQQAAARGLQQALAARIVELREKRDAAVAEVVTATSTRDGMTDRVTRARGAHDTVAARVAELQHRLNATQAVAD
ncbi:AAA family ATPase, partial [Marisediminicola senii]|uniref:AAA family ATPase n=1 Tax=Marisediminicola senii TaxID=2711233 RepID=UPI0013EC0EBA